MLPKTKEIKVVVTFETTFVGVPGDLKPEELLDFCLPRIAESIQGKLPEKVNLYEGRTLLSSTTFKLNK